MLDAGGLIALERNQRSAWDIFGRHIRGGATPVTHAGVVAQVWRQPERQVRLVRALEGVDVAVLDATLGKAAGRLLAVTGGTDIVDAALIALTRDGDEILTSDAEDLRQLAMAHGAHIELIPVR